MLMIMKLPMAHRPISESEARIQGSLLIQSGPLIPTMPRIPFSQPVLVLRKPSQTSVPATNGIWMGMKKSVRNSGRPVSFW